MMSSLTTDGIGSDNVARSSRPVLGFRWPPLSSKSTETCPACRSVGCALPVGSWPARWRGAGRPVPFGEGMIAGGAEAGTNRARPQRAARKRVTARWWWVGDDRQVTSATRASQSTGTGMTLSGWLIMSPQERRNESPSRNMDLHCHCHCPLQCMVGWSTHTQGLV